MISGERPVTAVETMRASGVRPRSRALVSLMTTPAAAPSLSGQGVPAAAPAPGGEPREAEVAGLGVAHDDDGGGAVVERAGVTGGDPPVGAEHRLEAGDALEGGAGARAVVGADDGAVGRGDGGDLPLPEPLGDRPLPTGLGAGTAVSTA